MIWMEQLRVSIILNNQSTMSFQFYEIYSICDNIRNFIENPVAHNENFMHKPKFSYVICPIGVLNYKDNLYLNW